jgi:uncharacterized caspase-like protein
MEASMLKQLAMKQLTTVLFGFAMLLLAVGPAAAEKRVALVIGNSAYENVPRLQNPSNDASDIAEKLRQLGFDVVEGLDLGKRDMEKQIRAFGEKLTGADVGLFYYAGHGLQVDQKNFLAPIDAQLKTESDLDFEAVELDLVLKQMLRNAHTSIVFLDACRDNPLAANLAQASRSLDVGRGLARVEAPASMMVVYSTEPGKVALDGTGRNSPFAEALLHHIDSEGESIGDMLIDVRNDVLKATDKKQRPFESASLTGQFFFKPGVPKTAAADTSADTSSEIAALRQQIDRLQADQGAQISSQQEQLKLLQQKLANETSTAGEPAPASASSAPVTNRVIAVEPANPNGGEASAAPAPNAAAPSPPETTKIAAADAKSEAPEPQASKTEVPALPEGVTREELASDIITELKELDCYQGRVTGKWGEQSQDALQRFDDLAKLELPLDEPQPATLEALKGWKGPHCETQAVEAPHGKHPRWQAGPEAPAPHKNYKAHAEKPQYHNRAASSPPPSSSHGASVGDEQQELQRLFPSTNWPGKH